jgi:hypothetical protein
MFLAMAQPMRTYRRSLDLTVELGVGISSCEAQEIPDGILLVESTSWKNIMID